MSLPVLRDDALSSTPEGFRLLLSLPWIRSLPLWSTLDLAVVIDGVAASDLRCVVDDRIVALADLADEQGWWFVQDRLPVLGANRLGPGVHEVAVSFRLAVPYMPAGSGPLTLPFEATRMLVLDAEQQPSSPPPASSADRPGAELASLPDGWTLAASTFNWTPEVIRAERVATDIAVGIVTEGVADVIELEPGQLWRSFPQTTAAEVEELRKRLADAGGSVSIVGASLDDWSAPGRPRSDEDRWEFLLPQLKAAHRIGARGVRLPAGQAGRALLERTLPALHDLDLTLYEEVQGQQAPSSPGHAPVYETIAEIDNPRLRLLVDISMLMPALPVSYLERMEAGGVPSGLLARLARDWRDPATNDAVVTFLRAGEVPPHLLALYMDMIVRFGRSDAAELRQVLPLIGGFHLKFWDLDDADGRVSNPIRNLGELLSGTGFRGTFCSEWGGHEWLDTDAADMTRRHLTLAREVLADGTLRPS